MLALLRVWAEDPDVHVRRLVSEGTRPRLPWAPRLRRFQQDPRKDASADQQWLIRHALRSSVKRAESGALNVLGFDGVPEVRLARIK
jgi:3-methyladenine DNA glycosylase AlkC